MDYLMNVIKILAILAALITLRVVVQAVVRRKGSVRFLKGILPFALPPLIAGGPRSSMGRRILAIAVTLCAAGAVVAASEMAVIERAHVVLNEDGYLSLAEVGVMGR